MHGPQPVLLFDLGGVLIESKMFSELKRLMGSAKSEAELIELWLSNPISRRFELGECSISEFANSIIDEFGLPMEPVEFLEAFKSWPIGFYDGAISMLEKLRRKSTVCCLSNSNEAHWNDNVTEPFDYAFSSHLIGCVKPDRSAFEHVVSRIGATPADIHFFDDAAVNVSAAQDFGFNAYHTVGYLSVKRKLKELGFLI